ncbi:MAG: hypothetical protein JWP69_1462 [Flaviaesturariibacter sp.]|nr:hypothetical protein [Flaviaesturariibacter sp.]
MKKISFILSLFVVAFAGTATAQSGKYYYYPSSNVYLDPVKQVYIYPAGGTWTQVSALPASYNVKGAQRVTVYSPSGQVWQHNATHKTKYKKTTPAPKGKAVGYKGTNPNSTKVYKTKSVHQSHNKSTKTTGNNGGGRGKKG